MFQTLAEVTTNYEYTYSSGYDSTTSAAASGFVLIFLLFVLAILVFAIVAMWKVFVKAGKPGWAAIVPIYNSYVLLEVVGRPAWWLVLMLVPYVNIVVYLLVAIDLAKSFGKSTGFGVGALWIFAPIGYAILGFGDAQYQGPSASQTPAAPAGPAQVPPAAPTPPAAK